ncbi:MAG: glycosyltransferase family 4 protein [Desulfobacterales bacterium]|nr:glycosyltransferase family 4 protein [Desulfobacterales bacterium]
MKILHLISQPPDFTGSGKFIRQIIRHARKKGHDNFLVAGVQAGFQLPGELISEKNAALVRFDNRDLPFPVAGMSDAMPYESTLFSKMPVEQLELYKQVFKGKIRRAINQFRPDLVHSHHLWIVSALARASAPDLPMVTTCHGTCLRQHRFCGDISKRISPALKGIDRVMALSISQQQEIVGRFGYDASRVPVMAGGYDDTLFKPAAKPENGIVEMVYAGKLCRAKGVPWLLKSLERIKDLPFRLHLAGGGSGREKEACLALAGALGEKAVYHGVLSHGKLAALLGRSHLFILPSFFEGVPLVLMEALACGCRILSTDLPGAKEILPPGSGNLARFIPLPPLETIDAPYRKDEPRLEELLAERLQALIPEILQKPAPDRTLIEEAAGPHTWTRVFDRIEGV